MSVSCHRFMWVCPNCGPKLDQCEESSCASCGAECEMNALSLPDHAARSWSFTVDGIATKRGPAPGASGRKGHLHASAATVGYEQRIAGAAIDAGLAAGVGPCSVHVVVWLPDRHARDDDRIKCAVNDGLKRAGKAALADDSMLVIQDSRVTLGGIDRRRPRLEITVTMLDTDRSK